MFPILLRTCEGQPYFPPPNDLPELRCLAREFYSGQCDDYRALMSARLAAGTGYKDDRPRQVLHEVMMEVGGRYAVRTDNATFYVQGACAVRLTRPWRYRTMDLCQCLALARLPPRRRWRRLPDRSPAVRVGAA